MGVAIAFAVSWKPFVKSKKSASAMTSTMIRAAASTVRFPLVLEWRGADEIGVTNEQFTERQASGNRAVRILAPRPTVVNSAEAQVRPLD
jgi:hypothetical protein